ncbi:hypothetical protein [Enterococcus sp. DIV0800]|uniref:hypothetical protein n=1 Tax=unclassified Enterococcus TaxID=2608891 RepID=UPI003D3007AA
MNLRKYVEQRVKIKFTDGVETVADVIAYTPAIDTDTEEFDEIVIKGSPEYPGATLISSEEIGNIEIIS